MGNVLHVSKVFAEKYIKSILQEMKNGLSLRQQQLQVIMIRYNLRNKSPAIPAIHTESFKNTFFNRIVVKYNVAL